MRDLNLHGILYCLLYYLKANAFKTVLSPNHCLGCFTPTQLFAWYNLSLTGEFTHYKVFQSWPVQDEFSYYKCQYSLPMFCNDFSPWEVIQYSYKVCRQLKTYGKFYFCYLLWYTDFFFQLSTCLENIVNLRKVLFDSSAKCQSLFKPRGYLSTI